MKGKVLEAVVLLCGLNRSEEKLKEYVKKWDVDEILQQKLDEIITEDNLKLGRKELNQLLLLIGADPVSEDFFTFVFGGKINSYNDFKNKCDAFRIKSALRFGNIKYAFRYFAGVLSFNAESGLKLGESPKHVWDELSISPEALKKEYMERASQPLQLIKIDLDKRYLNSEINRPKEDDSNYEEGVRISNKGKFNSMAYLTSDYIDVYVATSMRTKKQFNDIGEKIERIFNDNDLKNLNIRYFDPTISDCDGRINKGLIEGLMLKRAKVTLYLAQEQDSLGKDSELATTLMQGKNVIVYVPTPDKKGRITELTDNLKNSDVFGEELTYIRTILFKKFCSKEKSELSKTVFADTVDFEKLLPFINEIVDEEIKYYDQRAILLKEKHPLGLQVNLNTGVAHGVIVVRTNEEAVKIIKDSLLNSLELNLVEEENALLLKEKTTGSVVRYISKDPFLTKTFWAHYLDLDRHE